MKSFGRCLFFALFLVGGLSEAGKIKKGPAKILKCAKLQSPETAQKAPEKKKVSRKERKDRKEYLFEFCIGDLKLRTSYMLGEFDFYIDYWRGKFLDSRFIDIHKLYQKIEHWKENAIQKLHHPIKTYYQKARRPACGKNAGGDFQDTRGRRKEHIEDLLILSMGEECIKEMKILESLFKGCKGLENFVQESCTFIRILSERLIYWRDHSLLNAPAQSAKRVFFPNRYPHLLFVGEPEEKIEDTFDFFDQHIHLIMQIIDQRRVYKKRKVFMEILKDKANDLMKSMKENVKRFVESPSTQDWEIWCLALKANFNAFEEGKWPEEKEYCELKPWLKAIRGFAEITYQSLQSHVEQIRKRSLEIKEFPPFEKNEEKGLLEGSRKEYLIENNYHNDQDNLLIKALKEANKKYSGSIEKLLVDVLEDVGTLRMKLSSLERENAALTKRVKQLEEKSHENQ